MATTNPTATPAMTSDLANLLNSLVNEVVSKAYVQGINSARASVDVRRSAGATAACDPVAIASERRKKKKRRKRKSTKRNGGDDSDEEEDVPEIKGKQNRKRGMRTEETNVLHVSRVLKL